MITTSSVALQTIFLPIILQMWNVIKKTLTLDFLHSYFKTKQKVLDTAIFLWLLSEFQNICINRHKIDRTTSYVSTVRLSAVQINKN